MRITLKPKCVITGASGLLGSFLIPQLNEYEVFALGTSKPSTNPSHCHHIPIDLNAADFERHLPDSIDTVIHLAQSNHFKDFPEKAKDIININTLSTIRLLDYARQAKAKSFIYASSGAVYGTPAAVCKEDTPLILDPKKGLYYASKLSSEMFVESYSSFMKTVLLRFFFIYGPGQRKNMLIPRLVQSVEEGKPISLQGPQGMRINPIYAADAADAVKNALSIPQSATINVAGSEVLSLKQIGEAIGVCIDKEPCFEINHSTPPIDLIGDVAKMNQLLAIPKVKFAEGIQKYWGSIK